MIKHYLTVALRNLWKYKTQSLISILGLVASIVCFAWFSYFYRVPNRGDQVFPTYGRMAEFVIYDTEKAELDEQENLFLHKGGRQAIINQLKDLHIAGVEAVAQYGSTRQAIVCVDSKAEAQQTLLVKAMFTNEDFLKVFPTKIHDGNSEEYAQQANAAVLTPALAQQLFHGQSAIGQTLTLHGFLNSPISEKQTYTVVAIVHAFKPYSIYSDGSCQLWLRSQDDANLNFSRLLLTSSTKVAAASDQASRMSLPFEKDTVKAKIVLCSQQKRPSSILSTLLLVTGLLVLCVGYVNYINFSIGSFFNRGQEMYLRRSLGAKPYQQYLLLFTNLAIILTLVLLLTGVFAELGLPIVNRSLTTPFFRVLYINSSDFIHYLLYDFLALLGISALTVFVSIKLVRRRVARHRIRNFMLGLQFFVTLLFFFAIVIISLQSEAFSQTSLNGLSKSQADRILKVTLSDSYHLHQHREEIHRHLKGAPYIQQVSRQAFAVGQVAGNRYDGMRVSTLLTDKAWFSIRSLPEAQKIKENEPFAFYCRGSQSIIEHYSLGNSITLKFRNSEEQTYPLLGGVDYSQIFSKSSFDFHMIASHDNLSKENYFWWAQLKPGVHVSSAKRELNELLQSMVPEGVQLVPVKTLTEDSYLEEIRITKRIGVVCTIVTLLITLLGLYGAITLDTERRQKEVAIRKVNGAKVRHIYWLFGRMYVTLFAVAAAIACALTLGVVLYLSKSNALLFNYRNPLPWLLVLTVAAGFIFVTVAYRIYKIARINPADIIKTE